MQADKFVDDDHRNFVGGHWERIGRLQLCFMRKVGLTPDHVLLDIGCGALRAGVHFIPYLQPGNYLGIEAERRLLEKALNQELPEKIRLEKRPELIISRQFEFHRLSKKPDFAIANSVFTHLNVPDIQLCLRNLRAHSNGSIFFYTSFFEVDRPYKNPSVSHAQKYFAYTQAEMRRFGQEAGFDCLYIGDWDHPRDQKMFLYFVDE